MNNCKNAKKSTNERNAGCKVLHVLGIVLCVLLALVLLGNCVLIISSAIHPNTVPAIGNYSPLIVLSESMDPQIKKGDLIICKRISEEAAKTLEVDTVISFFDPEEGSSAVVTHKIVEVLTDESGAVSYRTRGINNIIDDRLAVPAENVIGVYSGIRFAFIGSIVMFAQTPVGLVVFIAVPVLLVVLFAVLENRNKKRTEKPNPELTASIQEVERLRAEVESLRSEQLSQQIAELMSANPSNEALQQLLEQLKPTSQEPQNSEDDSAENK